MYTCNSCHQPIHQCCCNGSCPLGYIDFSCIIYHKSNNEVTELDGLNLSNGATLELIIETIDEKVKQLNVLDFTLPCLRASYVVNTMKQFTEAVDTKLCALATDVATALANSNTPITANDSTSIDFTTSGTLDHTVTAAIIVSPQADNLLSILSDGVYSAPQTLSINYTDKLISISNGNTINLTSLFVGGFLGNLGSDPSSPEDGQYWWRTDTSELKIRVNGTTRNITTTV